MTFNFERLFSVMIYCDKCTEELTPYISPNIESIYIGAAVFECKKCNYKVIVKVKE